MNKVIKVNEADLKKALEISNLLGRFDELDRLGAYIPTTKANARRAILRRQLEEKTKVRKEKKDDVVNIQISISAADIESQKDKKFSLQELFGKKLGKTTVLDQDEVINIFETFFGEEPEIRQVMVK